MSQVKSNCTQCGESAAYIGGQAKAHGYKQNDKGHADAKFDEPVGNVTVHFQWSSKKHNRTRKPKVVQCIATSNVCKLQKRFNAVVKMSVDNVRTSSSLK
jgi:hypothetical protein